MKRRPLLSAAALFLAGFCASNSHAQTFDSSFELTSGSLPTLTLDLDGAGGNESFDAVAEGLTPFTFAGAGEAFLVTSLNAQDGSNFVLINGQDMCLGFNQPLVAEQQYEVCFYAAAWDHTQGTKNPVSVAPSIDIFDGSSNRTWVNGNAAGATEFPNHYSTGGTFGDYQAGENDYFNDITLSGTWDNASTNENDPNALEWSLYSFTFTANSSNESAFISLLGGDNRGLALDNIKLTAVPEPATGLLLAASGMLLSLRRRRS